MPTKKNAALNLIKDSRIAIEILIPRNSGLYFLFSEDELVYIGMSINTLNRIGTHFKNGHVFDRAFFIPCEPYKLGKYERACIKFFKPIINDQRDKTKLNDMDLEYINMLFTADNSQALTKFLKETNHQSKRELESIKPFI